MQIEAFEGGFEEAARAGIIAGDRAVADVHDFVDVERPHQRIAGEIQHAALYSGSEWIEDPGRVHMEVLVSAQIESRACGSRRQRLCTALRNGAERATRKLASNARITVGGWSPQICRNDRTSPPGYR